MSIFRCPLQVALEPEPWQVTLKPPFFGVAKPVLASVSRVTALAPIFRVRGLELPAAVTVRRVNEQGVAEDAESGSEAQQPVPVQERVSEPVIRIAWSAGVEQPSKVRVSELAE